MTPILGRATNATKHAAAHAHHTRIIESLTGIRYTGTKIVKLLVPFRLQNPISVGIQSTGEMYELVSNIWIYRRRGGDNTGGNASADYFLKMEFNEWHFREERRFKSG